MAEVSHIETKPLICRANQWIGFYMIGTSIMKELTNAWCPLKDHAHLKTLQLSLAGYFKYI